MPARQPPPGNLGELTIELAPMPQARPGFASRGGVIHGGSVYTTEGRSAKAAYRRSRLFRPRHSNPLRVSEKLMWDAGTSSYHRWHHLRQRQSSAIDQMATCLSETLESPLSIDTGRTRCHLFSAIRGRSSSQDWEDTRTTAESRCGWRQAHSFPRSRCTSGPRRLPLKTRGYGILGPAWR